MRQGSPFRHFTKHPLSGRDVTFPLLRSAIPNRIRIPLIACFFWSSSLISVSRITRAAHFIPPRPSWLVFISHLSKATCRASDERTIYVRTTVVGSHITYMVFTCHLGAIFREQLQLRVWKVPAKERKSVPACMRVSVRVSVFILR